MKRGVQLRRGDLALSAGLAAVGVALLLGVKALLGLAGPGGSDPDLWVLSAHNLLVGAAPLVPPLFPGILSLGISSGLGGVDLAGGLSTAFLGLTAGVVFLLCRVLGTPRSLGAGLAILGVSTPSVVALGLRAQPDALVALWLVCASAMAWAWCARGPGLLRLGGLLAFVVTGALLREHGLVLALCLCLLAGVGGGRLVGGGRVLLALLCLHLAPLLVGQAPDWLWGLPWNERLATAVFGDRAVGEGLPAEVARGMSLELRTSLGLLARPAWALARAPGAWAWLLLGLTSAVLLSCRNPARLALGLGLVPSLVALATWTDDRHVAVAVPLAVACWGAALVGQGPRGRRWLGLAGLVALGLSWTSMSLIKDRLREESERVETFRALGEALCEAAAPGGLAAGEQAAFLFCPMPLHLPDGSGADWRTWAVGRRPEGPGWRRLDLAGFRVYRLQPELEVRPCAEGAVPSSTPFLAAPVVPTALDRPCQGPTLEWTPLVTEPESSDQREAARIEAHRRRPQGRQSGAEQ